MKIYLNIILLSNNPKFSLYRRFSHSLFPPYVLNSPTISFLNSLTPAQKSHKSLLHSHHRLYPQLVPALRLFKTKVFVLLKGCLPQYETICFENFLYLPALSSLYSSLHSINNLVLWLTENWTEQFDVDKKNQLVATFCILYFSSNSCSTCFGQPCAHHQELTAAWCYSLVLVCAVAARRRSSPVGR